jgi:hypothetical protein
MHGHPCIAYARCVNTFDSNDSLECLSGTYCRCVPCVVTTLRIICCIIEETTEVDKNGPRGLSGNKVSFHFLRRSIWWDGDRPFLEADMILLPKSLDQCSTTKQWKDSSLNSLLFLNNRYFFKKKLDELS